VLAPRMDVSRMSDDSGGRARYGSRSGGVRFDMTVYSRTFEGAKREA
jgi:hypothetical protein